VDNDRRQSWNVDVPFHVEDHMEFGMMAVFTVAAPPSRSCPMEFLGGDFWKEPEKFTLRVKKH